MDEQTTADMDGGWKQLIEEYLEEFFKFFFPAVHAGIDFRQNYQYLDKELAQIMVDSESGRREVDKLIQVHWVGGDPDLILLHVEVQAQREADFAQRVCLYNYRIWDHYNRPVVSLALLVDGDPQFRPDRYMRQQAGCRLEFVFPIVKLLDFKSEEELNMPYVTSWERIARQEGREEGILQGVVELLRQTLEVRFGEIPASLLERIQQCQDVDLLRALHKQAITVGSLDELRF